MSSGLRHRVRWFAGYALAFGLGGLLIVSPTARILGVIALVLVGVVVSITRERWIACVILIALFVRILVIVADSWLGVLPVPPIEPLHHARAIVLVDAWKSGQLVNVLETDPMREFVAHVLAPFYLLFGQGLIAGRLGIAFVSTGIGYVVYGIAREVADARTAIRAAAVVLFWPSILYRSVVIQREVLVVIALLGVVWIAVSWSDTIDYRHVPVLVVLSWILYILRPENLLLVVVSLGAVLFLRSLRSPRYVLAGTLLVIPFGVFFIQNIEFFIGISGSVTPELIDYFAYRRAHGDATYLVGYHYRTWFDVIAFAPVKVVYFLFAPLPWHVDGPADLLAGISGWAVLASSVFWRMGVVRMRDSSDKVLVLLTYLVIGVTIYGIIEMNYGAAFRRRIQFVPILLVVAVVGLAHVTVTYGGHDEAPVSHPPESERL